MTFRWIMPHCSYLRVMLLFLPSDKLLPTMTSLIARGFLQVFRRGQNGVGKHLPHCHVVLMQAVDLEK